MISKLIRKFNSFIRLSFSEKVLLIQALILLPLVHLSLKLTGMKYTEKMLNSLSFTRENQEDQKNHLAIVIMTAKMVRIASHYQKFATCLRQSLVLWYLLKKQGINTKLCIGVRKEKDKFEAHAWLEYENIAINEIDNIKEMFMPIN